MFKFFGKIFLGAECFGCMWLPFEFGSFNNLCLVFSFLAKVWNGPGWDKVGIEFTGSQPDPNFLPSLAPTNRPSVFVDISILSYLKEKEEKNYKQTASILVWIKFLCHWLNWHHNSELSCPSPRGISFSTSPSWDMRALKKPCLLYFLPAQGFGERKKTVCSVQKLRNRKLAS